MKKFICLFIVIITLSACSIAKISGSGPKPIILNQINENIEVIEEFKESSFIAFDYSNRYDVYDVIADKLSKKNVDAIINVRINIKHNFISFLVNLITLTTAQAHVIEVQGILIKYLNKPYEIGTTIDLKNNRNEIALDLLRFTPNH